MVVINTHDTVTEWLPRWKRDREVWVLALIGVIGVCCYVLLGNDLSTLSSK